jgi:hypothetical protein
MAVKKPSTSQQKIDEFYEESGNEDYRDMSANLRTPMCPICHSRPLDVQRTGYDHEVAACDTCGFHKYKD